MNHKRCEDCKTEYEDEVGRCPECNSRFFTSLSLREVPYSPTQTPTPKVPHVPPKSQYEIEEDRRRVYEAAIDPDLLAKFKHRFQLELQEIAYLEWRAMQPQWKLQVTKAESDPKSQASVGGYIARPEVATAVGVFMGTGAIRHQLDEMQKVEDSESSDNSGDEEGGIAGFLDGLFE